MNQEEINNLNKLIIRNETEAIFKKTSIQTKVQDQMAYSTKHKKNFYHPFLNSSKSLKREHPQTLYEATITLIPKPDKDTTTEEHYKPITLMNIDAKILNRISVNQIQQHIKTSTHHNQVGFIPNSQGWFKICKINVIHYILKKYKAM